LACEALVPNAVEEGLRGMAYRRRSASQKKAFTKAIPRDSLPGRKREGPPKAARQPEWAALLKRLRRLELALAEILDPKGSIELTRELARDIRERARSEDGGEEVPLLRERSLQGQAEGDHGAHGRPTRTLARRATAETTPPQADEDEG